MIKVVLTANLQKYYPHARFESAASTLRALLDEMNAERALFSSYIIDESGTIRRHVNVFVNGDLLTDKSHLDVALPPGTQVHIMQALSGG